MTLPSYPSELPPPRRPDYQMARGDGRTKSRNDAGPRNTRRRVSAVANTIQMTTDLERDELARFERFFDEDTEGGALPFLMVDHATDGWSALDDEGDLILMDDEGTEDDGQPVLLAETMVVQFGERLWSYEVRGVIFRVSFEVEVLPS